jgi:cytochrome c oxidase subunit 3
MVLFFLSEVMFFFAFFWASSHSSLAPTVEIGGIWPPKGIGVLDPWEIPFLNTLILLSSGAAVTWAHHAILAGKEKRAVYALVATVSLAFKEWNIIKHPPLFQIVFMVLPFS